MPTAQELYHEHNNNELPDHYPEEEKQWPIPPWLRVLLAILLILGLLYIFGGLRELFFYKRTSPQAIQKPVESSVREKELSVPVQTIVLANDQANGSRRTEESVNAIVENAERIWEQASISFSVVKKTVLHVDDRELEHFYENTPEYILGLEAYDPAVINIIFIGKLGGTNGFAYSGINATSIADLTSTPDFRVLAHEIGHILHLDHTTDNNRLMYKGADSVILTTSEIQKARDAAKTF